MPENLSGTAQSVSGTEMRTKPAHEEHRHTLQAFSSPHSVVSANSAVKGVRTGKLKGMVLKQSMYTVLKSAMAVPEGKASPEYLKKFFKKFFSPFLNWSFLVFTKKEFFNKKESVLFKSP